MQTTETGQIESKTDCAKMFAIDNQFGKRKKKQMYSAFSTLQQKVNIVNWKIASNWGIAVGRKASHIDWPSSLVPFGSIPSITTLHYTKPIVCMCVCVVVWVCPIYQTIISQQNEFATHRSRITIQDTHRHNCLIILSRLHLIARAPFQIDTSIGIL